MAVAPLLAAGAVVAGMQRSKLPEFDCCLSCCSHRGLAAAALVGVSLLLVSKLPLLLVLLVLVGRVLGAVGPLLLWPDAGSVPGLRPLADPAMGPVGSALLGLGWWVVGVSAVPARLGGILLVLHAAGALGSAPAGVAATLLEALPPAGRTRHASTTNLAVRD